MTAPLNIIDAGGTHELVTVEVMRARGFLDTTGARIERRFVTNGAQAVEALLSGQGEAAMQIGFGPALKAIAQGAPLRIIAASNLLTVHAVYTRDPAIRRMADLTGKRVGIGARGALTHQLLHAALRKQGVDPDGVEMISMGNSASIFQSLLRGELDAGFGESEVFEHQAQYGVHALDDGVLWRELQQFPNQASYATLDTIANRREELVRVLAAHALLYRHLQSPGSLADFTEAREVALPGSDPEESVVQWRFYQQWQPFPDDLLLPPGHLSYLQKLNIDMGLQERELPFDAVADMSLAVDAVHLARAWA